VQQDVDDHGYRDSIRHDEASVLAKSSSSSENEYEPFQREVLVPVRPCM